MNKLHLEEYLISYKEVKQGNINTTYLITATEVEGIGCLVQTSDGITFVHGVQVEQTDIKVLDRGNLYKLVPISFT